MAVWRVHIKPDAEPEIDPARFCLDRDIVGVGWAIDTKGKTSISWDEFCQYYRDKFYQEPKYLKNWWNIVRPLYEDMKVDDLVWTRDDSNNYYLGRITSPWRYDAANENSRADVVNIRDCKWLKVGTEDKVLSAIINSFIPSKTVQAIRSGAAINFSQYLASKKWPDTYKGSLPSDIFAWWTPDELEDALALYLQMERNYNLVPSTCKKYTKTYECIFIHRETGESASTQVKSGQVTLSIDEYAKIETDKVFLLAESGNYEGNPHPKVETIDPAIIRNFVRENRKIMPGKLKPG